MTSDRPGRPADVAPEGEPTAERPPVEAGLDAGPVPGRDGRPVPVRRSARRRHRAARDQEKGSLLRELPVLLLGAFVLALLVKTFLVQAFFIPSGSMERTLHGCPGCTGDRVLVNKVPYWFGDPEPGDIIVFRGPDTWSPEVDVPEPTNWFTGALTWLGRTVGVAPPSEDDYIKRVIAVGGQTVQCCDAEGRVTVDDEPLDEPYIFENTPLESRAFGPVTVPEQRLWVMGDHRSASADSKAHIGDQHSGTVGVDDVIGKAAVIVWPLDRFGVLHSPDIQGTESAAAAGESGVRNGVAEPAVQVVPLALGLAGAVPVSARASRRRRQSGD